MRYLMFLLVVAACRFNFDPLDTSSGDAMSGTGDARESDAYLVPSTWQVAAVSPNTSEELWALAAFASNDIWVAGTNGMIQHFDGSTWTISPSGTTNRLLVAWGTSNDLWLVGSVCTSLHWMGSTWTPTSIPGCNGQKEWQSIHGVSSSAYWVSGTSGIVQQWDGTMWNAHGNGGNDYWDIYVNGLNDVIVVGTMGTINHWTGTWANEPTGVTTTLASIIEPAPGEYWVVGAQGVTLHKVGAGAWTNVPTTVPTTLLYDVAAVSPTDLWAVGSNGVILHGDGTSWVQVASPTTATLHAIQVIPGGGLIAVGVGGEVIFHP